MRKRLNKKGFTLMEVLTVIIVITALMMITLPLIGSITKKNQDELYHSYEKMMEEYAMASGIKNQNPIKLSELDGLDTVKKECEGYVSVKTNNYKAYIKCGEKYETDGYGSTMQSTGTIDSCQGCKFLYTTTKIYTTWNIMNQSPTVLTRGLYDSYLDVISANKKNYFLGVKLNTNKEVTNIYACGVKNNVPFCIEGTSNGSKYDANKELLQGADLYNNSCDERGYQTIFTISCGTLGDPSHVFAEAHSGGDVFIDIDNGRCGTRSLGYTECENS